MITDFYYTVGEIKTWFGVTKTILERGSEKWWGDESELICEPLQDPLKSSAMFLVTFIICQSWTGICRGVCDINPPTTLLAEKAAVFLPAGSWVWAAFIWGKTVPWEKMSSEEEGTGSPNPLLPPAARLVRVSSRETVFFFCLHLWSWSFKCHFKDLLDSREKR